MFVAGADTVGVTLHWTTFLLALHPEIQEKLYDEINSIAEGREVSLEDRPRF